MSHFLLSHQQLQGIATCSVSFTCCRIIDHLRQNGDGRVGAKATHDKPYDYRKAVDVLRGLNVIQVDGDKLRLNIQVDDKIEPLEKKDTDWKQGVGLLDEVDRKRFMNAHPEFPHIDSIDMLDSEFRLLINKALRDAK